MNKTMKTLGTILACLAITGTCLAAPRGGHHGNRAPAPMHHTAPRHHNPPPPPPPPPRHHHHHHDRCDCRDVGVGAIAIGAAVVGGIIGALAGR